MDCFIFGWIMYKIKTDVQWVVDVKYILFTDITKDYDLFKQPIQALNDFGFKTDYLELKQKMNSLIDNKVNYVKRINRNISFASETEKAKSIVLMFSKSGDGKCFGDISLLEKLLMLQEGNGKGCCSDHAEAFIALSSYFGLTAREVHTLDHVTNEYYDNKLKKWIWVDPTYAILAKNKNGKYLSLLELRNLYYNNEKVHYEFFGNKHHCLSFDDPYLNSLYDEKEDFSNIIMTLGNNVFEEDNFNHRLHFLPKYLKQFVGIGLGIIPSYLMYVDDNSNKAKTIIRKKYLYTGVFVFLLVGSISFLLCIMIEEKFRHKKNV